MQPIKHPLCNDVLRKPEGMTEDECRDLHIRRDDGAVWSFWKPNPEELLALNWGGAVALAVMGETHPPLSIFATHPTEEKPMRPAEPSEYLHRMEVVNARLIALTNITKKALGMWAANHPEDKDRAKITDKFLDMLNANKTDGSLVETVPADEPPAITETDLARYRSDAEGWKAEAEALQQRIGVISEALGDEWNVMPFPEAITALKNRLAMAEAAKDALAVKVEVAEGEAARWEKFAKAASVDITELQRCLSIKRENIISAIEDVIEKALNPNPAES